MPILSLFPSGASNRDLNEHIETTINSSNGVHGLRYDTDTESFELYDTETGTWGEITAGQVNFASFEIDPSTGVLYMTTPDKESGATFSIDEDGYLEVSV